MANNSDAAVAKEYLDALAEINPQFRKLEPLFKLIARDYSGVGLPFGMPPAAPGVNLATNITPGMTPGQVLKIDTMDQKALVNLKSFASKLLDEINARLERLGEPREEKPL